MSREMKNSDIPWIGEIPICWEIRQFRRLYRIHKDIANCLGFEVLSVTQKGIRIKDLSKNEGQIAQDYSKYQLVSPNDFVMNHMDLLTGYIDISQYYGVTSPDYRVFQSDDNKNVCDRFYLYIFQLCYKYKIFYTLGQGVSGYGRWRLPAEQLLLFYLPYPSISEQKAIADYLDKKCSEIDEMIAIQETFIEELKAYKQSVITEAVTKGLDPNVTMKDSGIMWIGTIPQHWNVQKMSRLCSTITDFVASGSFESLRNNVPYLDEPDYAMLVRTADLSGSSRNLGKVYISEHSYNFLQNSNLFGGEVILPNIGASVGDVYIVPKLYERMSLAPNSIMFKTLFIDKYFYYFFFSSSGKQSIFDICQSTAQGKFNKTELRGIKVCVPPCEEQQQIAEYLDKKCSEIDQMISLKQSKIDQLKEYKKSLIYECVTGKKDI